MKSNARGDSLALHFLDVCIDLVANNGGGSASNLKASRVQGKYADHGQQSRRSCEVRSLGAIDSGAPLHGVERFYSRPHLPRPVPAANGSVRVVRCPNRCEAIEKPLYRGYQSTGKRATAKEELAAGRWPRAKQPHCLALDSLGKPGTTLSTMRPHSAVLLEAGQEKPLVARLRIGTRAPGRAVRAAKVIPLDKDTAPLFPANMQPAPRRKPLQIRRWAPQRTAGCWFGGPAGNRADVQFGCHRDRRGPSGPAWAGHRRSWLSRAIRAATVVGSDRATQGRRAPRQVFRGRPP